MSFFKNTNDSNTNAKPTYTDEQKLAFRKKQAGDTIAQLPNIIKLLNGHPKATPAMTKAIKEIGASENSRSEWVDALLSVWDGNAVERDKLNF